MEMVACESSVFQLYSVQLVNSTLFSPFTSRITETWRSCEICWRSGDRFRSGDQSKAGIRSYFFDIRSGPSNQGVNAGISHSCALPLCFLTLIFPQQVS